MYTSVKWGYWGYILISDAKMDSAIRRIINE
jgi:hypothetical protein